MMYNQKERHFAVRVVQYETQEDKCIAPSPYLHILAIATMLCFLLHIILHAAPSRTVPVSLP